MAALLWARERRDSGAADRRWSRVLWIGLVADLLAVELHRPARRPRGARRAALEPALDPRRGRRRRGRRGRSSSLLAGGSLEDRPLDRHQHRHQRPRQPRLRRHPTSSPSARSTATARAPSRRAYREHVETGKAPVSVSHTEPITVAAEQGLVGLAAYAALLVDGAVDDGRRRPVRLRPAGPDRDRPPAAASRPRRAPSSRPSSRCWSTRWPTPGSSRTRSPGCCWRSARRWRPPARGPRRPRRLAACRDTCAAWRRPAPPTRRRASSRS